MKISESTWSRKFGLSVKKMNSREISERYRLIADYHTYTRYSKGLLVYYHGKGTIEENVAAAAAKGLQEIGITDHGPGHIFYGLNLSLLPDMRRDVAEAARKYPEVKIQLGVEANIIHSGNGLDVAPEDIEKFDFINAGYHHGVPKGDMIRNPICSAGIYPSGSRQQLENRNTEMALRAIYENPIRILTHPGDKGPDCGGNSADHEFRCHLCGEQRCPQTFPGGRRGSGVGTGGRSRTGFWKNYKY